MTLTLIFFVFIIFFYAKILSSSISISDRDMIFIHDLCLVFKFIQFWWADEGRFYVKKNLDKHFVVFVTIASHCIDNGVRDNRLIYSLVIIVILADYQIFNFESLSKLVQKEKFKYSVGTKWLEIKYYMRCLV